MSFNIVLAGTLSEKTSLSQERGNGAIAGIASGVPIFIIVGVMIVAGVILLKLVLSRRSTKRQMERLQLDILAM